MNVAELRRHLEQLDDDMEVHFAYNYGDHWRTTVAPAVESVDTALVRYSDYHSMDAVVENAPDQDDDHPGVKSVVVLRS